MGRTRDKAETLTFEQAFEYTDKIRGAFHEECCKHYFKYAMRVPHGGTMVEVGVHYGRSATLLMQAARELDAKVILVDVWLDPGDAYPFFMDMLARDFSDVDVQTIKLLSQDAAPLVAAPIDFIHIDAYHDYLGGIHHPRNDCSLWLPKLASGGIACIHDYGVEYICVTEAVDEYTRGWEDYGAHESLTIRRKP